MQLGLKFLAQFETTNVPLVSSRTYVGVFTYELEIFIPFCEMQSIYVSHRVVSDRLLITGSKS